MAVAFDAFSASATGTTTRTWTHTPVGTPRAAIVFVVQIGALDEISGVTYGGTAMTEVAGSPNLKVAPPGEAVGVYAYFLGASVPAGAQTVTATASGTTLQKKAYAYTLTAAADTESVDVDATINSASVENPSVVLSLAGRTSFAALGFGSGQNAITGVTELTGWTARDEVSDGAQTLGTYSYNTIGTPDVTAGWTQTAEDAAMIALAISEVAVAGHPAIRRHGMTTSGGVWSRPPGGRVFQPQQAA